MTARPSRTRSVESSGTGRLLVAPADPRIEASCRYARGADARELIEHTEQQMLDDSVWLLPADYQMGVDFGLAEAYSHARKLRLADGPDEVHRNQIGQLELRKYSQGA